jgi:Tfp pilus assembly protein PilF
MRTCSTFFALVILGSMTADAQPAADALAAIDAMRDQGAYSEAVIRLEQMQGSHPGNAEVLWRLARTRVDIGEQRASLDEQATHYRAAIEDARRAVEVDPNNAEAHLALAIASGRVGLISPTRQKIELSRDVKEHVDRAIELDPSSGTSYHVRGRWHYEVASLGFVERTVVRVVYGGLPQASYEQAAADFRRSIEAEDTVLDRLELGRTYLKLGDRVRARAELERAVGMPTTDPKDPTHQQEARELLAGVR